MKTFKPGTKVKYQPTDPSDCPIPKDWKGVIVNREPNIDDGHYYNVRWTTPVGNIHTGIYHATEIHKARHNNAD